MDGSSRSLTPTDHIRRGNLQASLIGPAWWIIHAEVLAGCAFAGLLNKSWWIFGISFLVGEFLLRVFRPLRYAIAGIVTVSLAFGAWHLGLKTGQFGAPTIFAALTCLLSWRIHRASAQWIDDVTT